MKLKTILSSPNKILFHTTDCGYLNRSLRKQLKEMKIFAAKHSLTYVSGNQISGEEADIGIILKRETVSELFIHKNLKPDDYEIILNLRIVPLTDYGSIEIVDEVLNFPFLQATSIFFNKIRIAYYNDNLKIFNEEVSGERAILFQKLSHCLKGFSILNPLRNNKNFSFYKNSEEIYPHTMKRIKNISEKYRKFVTPVLEEEDVKKQNSLRYSSIERAEQLIALNFQPYNELIKCLERDLENFPFIKKEQFLKISQDNNMARRWEGLIANMDFNNEEFLSYKELKEQEYI